MGLKLGFGIAFGLAVLMSTPAFADPPLEGTGSQWTQTDKPLEPFSQKTLERIEKLRVSSEKGVAANDMLDYGSILEYGIGPAGVDLKGAYDLYEKAANLGNAIARRRMCIAYLLGQGRPLNRPKAYNDYCNKLTDSDPTVLFSTGYDYEFGLNGAKDEDMALSLYIQAFKKGSPDAMDAVGRILLTKDKPQNALAFLRQAVFNGSAEAMNRLAGLLEAGKVVEADADEAWWLYVNAARRGNPHAIQRLKGLPERQPLNQVNLIGDKTSLITQTETKNGKARTTPFSPMEAGNKVFAIMPQNVVLAGIEGRVDLHCYINKQHNFDTCVMQSEYPLGYGYGPYLLAYYNGVLRAADVDCAGHPTAGTVFAVSYRWVFK